MVDVATCAASLAGVGLSVTSTMAYRLYDEVVDVGCVRLSTTRLGANQVPSLAPKSQDLEWHVSAATPGRRTACPVSRDVRRNVAYTIRLRLYRARWNNLLIRGGVCKDARMIRIEHTFPRVNAVLCRHIFLSGYDDNDLFTQRSSTLLTLAEYNILTYMLYGLYNEDAQIVPVDQLTSLADHVVRQGVFMASFHAGGGGGEEDLI